MALKSRGVPVARAVRIATAGIAAGAVVADLTGAESPWTAATGPPEPARAAGRANPPKRVGVPEAAAGEAAQAPGVQAAEDAPAAVAPLVPAVGPPPPPREPIRAAARAPATGGATVVVEALVLADTGVVP